MVMKEAQLSTPSSITNRKTLERIIESRGIEPNFQPIVDLFSSEIIAYEILSRCPEHFQNPAQMFEEAHYWGLSWELECACRNKAFERIVDLQEDQGNRQFFMNVSPHTFNDPRFGHGFTLDSLDEYGIDQQRIVLEITEISQVTDYEFFQAMVKHYRDEGFRIALDDFGAGHSSLITLVASAPNFIKLDRALVSQIEQYSYKQHLVKSVLSFAANVESDVIAEGVETIAELKTLIRLGIRYAQGFLLSRPSPAPAVLSDEIRNRVRELSKNNNNLFLTGYNDSLPGLILRPPTIQKGTTTCEELDQLFHENAGVDHIVILDKKTPYATIGRQSFYASTGGPFGYSLLQRKPAETTARPNPLIVHEETEITALGRLAMGRRREELYDPVIIVNDDGEFIGTVTMKQLLSKFIDLEVQQATDCNPLTNLPGNRSIQRWISEAIQSPPFSILYADLDRFKEYNDTYGFSQGDRMI
ncbi:MAG: GGDEF domain-containing protein, partial [Candidatus Sumerlaeota bacterium]